MERENGELKTEVEELKKKLVTLEIRNGGKADSPDDVMFTGKVWDHLAQLLHGQMYVFVCGANYVEWPVPSFIRAEKGVSFSHLCGLIGI